MQPITQQQQNRLIFLVQLVFVFLAIFLIGKGLGAFKEVRFIGSSDVGPSVITVSGEGEVFAKPDTAEFTFSAQNEGATVAEAQTKTVEAMNAALAYLETQEIDEKDIKTINFSINPRYEFRPRPVAGPSIYDGENTRVLIGYEVTQTVRVKVRAIEKAGTLLGSLEQFKITDVSNLSFSVDDDEALRDEAREMAIDDAKDKAKALARDLGVSLVRIVSFNEGHGTPFYRYAESFDSAVVNQASPAPAPQLPVGENQFLSNVNITYEIQ